MGPHEPYWRTNTSFSPPPARWDYRFQSEGLRYGSNDSIQLFGSSTSSNSKESRNWLRGNYHQTHQYSASDGTGLYFSSPSDTSLIQPWTSPPVQEISIDEFETSAKRDPASGPLPFLPMMEGTSRMLDGGGSTSSRSDGSECEHMAKLHLSAHRSFPSRRSFMSKPIHPLSFPMLTSTREALGGSNPGFPEYDATTPQREAHRSSSGSSSIDVTDISEQFESDNLDRGNNPAEGFRCGLCERLLSQRSPWSSRRIVRSGDMPVTGVLSCRHVFHAECLEQTTPKARKNDPPCPLCLKSEENSPEQRAFSRLRNNFPRLRPFTEEGSSRPWGCAQAGDCVEGVLRAPQRSSMLLLNRNRLRKSLSLKGTMGKDFPGKWSKGGSYPLQRLGERFIGRGPGGCSKAAAGPSPKG
ncbi:hypothetical protein Ancab_020742 [Ancistrocladus abbreviatus]